MTEDLFNTVGPGCLLINCAAKFPRINCAAKFPCYYFFRVIPCAAGANTRTLKKRLLSPSS